MGIHLMMAATCSEPGPVQHTYVAQKRQHGLQSSVHERQGLAVFTLNECAPGNAVQVQLSSMTSIAGASLAPRRRVLLVLLRRVGLARRRHAISVRRRLARRRVGRRWVGLPIARSARGSGSVGWRVGARRAVGSRGCIAVGLRWVAARCRCVANGAVPGEGQADLHKAMLLALFAEHGDLLLVRAIGADLGQLTTASTDVVVRAQHILVLDSQREVVLCRQQQNE